MKRILLILLIVLFIPCNSIYADSELVYSEWSTTKMGYSKEEEAIQYGVILPKEWSEWSTVPSGDPVDSFFEVTKDFGTKMQVDKGANKGNVDGGTIYDWDFGEVKHITSFYIDVDCFNWDGKESTNYRAPALQLYVDNILVASCGEKDKIDDNWGGSLDVWGSTASLKMSSCYGGGRNSTDVVGTWIKSKLIKYSHVISWNEPANHRFDTPYELKGGAESQKPFQRTVYRYPLNPEITVEKRYLYEESIFEDIKNLATAIDYDDNDITERIGVTKIKYDDCGEIVYNPEDFDSSKSNTIHVTYYVINDLNVSDEKTVKLYILKNGLEINFNIYDRYISEDYLYTLENDSIWKSENFKEKLDDAIEWLERK